MIYKCEIFLKVYNKELMTDLIWILAIVLGLYLLQQILLTKENFCVFGRDGKNCDKIADANNTCKQLAEANCRIPTWMNNDCWLNEYQECKKSGKFGMT